MRFGASTWAFAFPFRSPSDEQLVDRMARLGCDHFELGGESLTTPGAVDLGSLRRATTERGMTASICGIFTADLDLSSLDGAIRQAGLAHMLRLIDAAEELGAGVVVGAVCGVGGNTIPDGDERRRRNELAAEGLRKAGERAAAAGVRLGVEPLNRYENNFLNTIEQAEAIVLLVDHPNVGLHLDLFHANIEEGDLGDVIRRAGRHLVHCHAVDSNRAAPGSGHLPWDDVAAGLRDIGYDSALVIETFDPSNPAIAALAAFWRPFAPSQDALVRDGIAFLRDLTAGSRPST